MGLFIVFEGVEGSGKTTQVARSAAWLRSSQARPVVQTREPGGTVLGRKLRSLLLDVNSSINSDGNGASDAVEVSAEVSDRAELLLYAADRAHHIEQLIRPQLAQGAILLCDRFTASTVAYQGYGRGLDLALIEQLNAIATANLAPDLTLWLDLDPALGLQRAHDRGEVNRMDRESLAFHQRVQQGYQAVAAQLGDRCVRIDAAQPLDCVTQAVQAAIQSRL